MKYLKQFVIGSGGLVILPVYYAVYNKIQNESVYFDKLSQSSQPLWWPFNQNFYSYFGYTFFSPIWFGLWNVISLMIAEQFNLSMRMRFIIVAILSSIAISNIIIIYKLNEGTTTFTQKLKIYIRELIVYMIIWNVVIYNIEKHI